MRTSWNLDLVLSKLELKNLKKLRESVITKIEAFHNKWKNNKEYLTDPKVLKQALDELEDIRANYGFHGKEVYYYWLKKILNQQDNDTKAKYDQIYHLSVELANKIQFFEINLSKISKETRQKFLNSHALKNYKHYLKRLFQFSDYILSDEQERILNLKSKTSYENWVDMVDSLLSKQERDVRDEKGNRVKKNFSELLELTNDKNKKVRDSAAAALNSIFNQYVEIGEFEFNSVLEDKKISDELRGYKRPDMPRIIGDDLDEEIVDTLVEVVTENFDISKKYYEKKAKMLGLKKLKYYERNIPVGELSDKIEFNEAYKLVKKVFTKLDPEFGEIYETFFTEGRVDVFPKKGKSSGAFCIHVLKASPIYVMLNYGDKIENVRVIAHEFGHALHSFYSIKTQNALQCDYPTSTAECASTFFEDFVTEEVEKKLDEQQKVYLKMMQLGDGVSTIFRQIAFYNFEKEMHKVKREKGFVSKEEIGRIFRKHMESYMGDFVEQSQDSENWWLYISHFRRPFYVYSYAFGALISKALQRKVRQDKSFIKEIKKFLSSGGAMSPKEIFMHIGIDISQRTIWEEGIKEMRDELEAL
ncbi:MAG: M3 family oligoendopeptidase [Candidatus Dojkabacteria bacterium]